MNQICGSSGIGNSFNICIPYSYIASSCHTKYSIIELNIAT